MKEKQINKKFNWIQDEIELDFDLCEVLQNEIKKAEKYDLEGCDWKYFLVAESIELLGKGLYSGGVITKKQWNTLCDKYPGEERF